MGIEIARNGMKKGQVTIFIIAGIILAVGIIFGFLFFGKTKIQERGDIDPEKFIEKCLKEAVSPSIDKVLLNGGVINPELFILNNGEKYNYLCYQKNYYLSCINHYPQLKKIAETQIMSDSESRIKNCFVKLKQDLEKRGFTENEKEMNWNLEISPKKIFIKINKKLDISKGSNSQSFESFDAVILSPLYELIMVSREIVNQEAQFCNFEYNGFMLLYPEYNIRRIDYEDSKLYNVKDRLTSKEFKFAVRSCAFPPGL